jgi:hypothetical protein
MSRTIKWWLSVFGVAVGLNLMSWGAIWTYCQGEAEERWTTVGQEYDRSLVEAAVNGKKLAVATARSKAGLPPVQRSEQAQAKITAANIRKVQHAAKG